MTDKAADIEITGHHGFYQIRACTLAATKFMRRVQGFAHGAAYSDDTRMTETIAIDAVAIGLCVSVNGHEITVVDGSAVRTDAQG